MSTMSVKDVTPDGKGMQVVCIKLLIVANLNLSHDYCENIQWENEPRSIVFQSRKPKANNQQSWN